MNPEQETVYVDLESDAPVVLTLKGHGMKIEPCKMCGGDARLGADGWMWNHCWWVECTQCGRTGPQVDADDYTILKTERQLAAIAVRRWNRRNRK